MNKRTFLRTLGVATLSTVVRDDLWARFTSLSPERLAEDDEVLVNTPPPVPPDA